MNPDVLLFFNQCPMALPLYETLEAAILRQTRNAVVRVQKTQISFYNNTMFACVSLRSFRKKANLPENFISLTIGLPYRNLSSRIDVSTEPYPGRWTHHLTIENEGEIDEELLSWLGEAAAFSAKK